GGNYYSRAKDGFFEIPKPLSALGIGVDQLPGDIRLSEILSGNDLGMLANVEALPSQQDVDKFLINNPGLIGLKTSEKHKFAKQYLKNNDVESAWKVLLSK
ncbi:MAG: flavin reductase family protein, partial [Flavobacteriaceae bacterium]|nr:flavin reductase family protein [Flavobacteriaceae bacterium]